MICLNIKKLLMSKLFKSRLRLWKISPSQTVLNLKKELKRSSIVKQLRKVLGQIRLLTRMRLSRQSKIYQTQRMPLKSKNKLSLLLTV